MSSKQSNTLVKALIALDLLVALFQISVFFIYFTSLRTSISGFIEDQMGSYDVTVALTFLFSAAIFLIVVRGLYKKRRWAILLQAFLSLPLVGSFPIGTLLFLLLGYGLLKLEKGGGFT